MPMKSLTFYENIVAFKGLVIPVQTVLIKYNKSYIYKKNGRILFKELNFYLF